MTLLLLIIIVGVVGYGVSGLRLPAGPPSAAGHSTKHRSIPIGRRTAPSAFTYARLHAVRCIPGKRGRQLTTARAVKIAALSFST